MDDYVFDYTQYKSKINKKSKHGFVLIVFIICILFCVSIFLYPKNIGNYEFYFVEIGNFQTYNQAKNLSHELALKNAPGYIHYDNTYHVLSAFFPKYDQAESVVNNLKDEYKNVKILTIKSPKISKINFSFDPNKTIKNLTLTTNNILNELNNLNISYEKNEISYNNLSTQITMLADTFNNDYSEFSTFFKDDYTLNSAKKYMKNISESIENLKKTPEDKISFTLKNEIIKIAINHHLFLSFF